MFVYTVNDGRTFSPNVQANGVGVFTGSVSLTLVKLSRRFPPCFAERSQPWWNLVVQAILMGLFMTQWHERVMNIKAWILKIEIGHENLQLFANILTVATFVERKKNKYSNSLQSGKQHGCRWFCICYEWWLIGVSKRPSWVRDQETPSCWFVMTLQTSCPPWWW